MTEKIVYQVSNLDCPDCARSLQDAVSAVDGIEKAELNFALSQLAITPRNGDNALPTVEKVARDMGHPLTITRAQQPISRGDAAPIAMRTKWREWFTHNRRDALAVLSGIFIALAYVLRFTAPHLGLLIHSLYFSAIIAGGYYSARAGWTALHMTKSLDMNALMTIAVIGAVIIGEWAEGAMVIFLFAVGNALESHAMDRARNAIRALMDLSPPEATRLDNGHESRVAVAELRIGDKIIVKPGERIPMDGEVLSGAAAVNQAPITGESIPVEKTIGDEVYAGSINGAGALTVRVTRLAEDNTIARIIRMVEEAQAQRAPSQRFVDVFAKYYTPAVVGGAVLMALVPPLIWDNWHTWFYRALTLLVISCPCALVISTPVSIVSAIANAARQGVLVKGGAYLEQLGAVQVIAFDKTGTLTQGEPRVLQVRCVNDYDENNPMCDELLARAAAVEARSEHPLARAIVREAERRGVAHRYAPAENVTAIAGRGVRGKVGEHLVTVGNHAYLDEIQAHDAHLCAEMTEVSDAGQTMMVVGDECCGVQGYITVADTPRAKTAELLRELKRRGIKRTVMLTGDNEGTARQIANRVGVDEFRARLLPEDKVAAVAELLARYDKVAMVGDGVNDAPALATATVGIAMGTAGTAAALETADIALMADDLSKLPFAIGLSRATLGVIRQNIAFSLLVKALFVLLTLFTGAVTLWMAVFADMGVSLLVTLNGLRLLGYRKGNRTRRFRIV